MIRFARDGHALLLEVQVQGTTFRGRLQQTGNCWLGRPCYQLTTTNEMLRNALGAALLLSGWTHPDAPHCADEWVFEGEMS